MKDNLASSCVSRHTVEPWHANLCWHHLHGAWRSARHEFCGRRGPATLEQPLDRDRPTRSPASETPPWSDDAINRSFKATGKKTPGGAGTHTRHTEHADAQRHTDHTDEPHNHRNPPTTHTPHVSATTEAAADSTAAGPEPTAPRGRLRRGRPQRTRPCLHPLPERLPAPARRRSAK